jgi:hypothetical protein
MVSMYSFFSSLEQGGREAGKDEIVQRSVCSEKERDVDTLFYIIITVIFENISNITEDLRTREEKDIIISCKYISVQIHIRDV